VVENLFSVAVKPLCHVSRAETTQSLFSLFCLSFDIAIFADAVSECFSDFLTSASSIINIIKAVPNLMEQHMVQGVIPEIVLIPAEEPFVINFLPVGAKLKPLLGERRVGLPSTIAPSEFHGNRIDPYMRVAIYMGVYIGVHLDLVAEMNNGDVAEHRCGEFSEFLSDVLNGAGVKVTPWGRIDYVSNAGDSTSPTFGRHCDIYLSPIRKDETCRLNSALCSSIGI